MPMGTETVHLYINSHAYSLFRQLYYDSEGVVGTLKLITVC